MELRPPNALRRGDHIRIIAPSGPFDAASFAEGVERMRTRYRVSFEPGLEERRAGYLAGGDRERLLELRAALTDPGVDAIVCARGGYGATRLLPDLPTALIRDRAPLLVGFSDITALHAYYARAGHGSLHAPMAAKLGALPEALVERWLDEVGGRIRTRHEGLRPMAPAGRAPKMSTIAEGPLRGGNLSVLAALVGTPYLPPLQGALLYLEEVGESPYRLDRMLTTLRQAGIFEAVAGVVFGQLTECGPDPRGPTAEDAIRAALEGLPIPVALGLPCGHEEDNVALPLGRDAALDLDQGSLTFR